MGEADKRKCTKKFRLALWWLTYRLYVLEDVNSEAEKAARKHCKYTGEDWSRDRADFQQQWARYRVTANLDGNRTQRFFLTQIGLGK